MTTPATLDLLTTSQAAARLGVTPGRVRQLVARGRLAVTRIGDRNFVRVADLKSVSVRVRTGRPKTCSKKKNEKIPVDKS